MSRDARGHHGGHHNHHGHHGHHGHLGHHGGQGQHGGHHGTHSSSQYPSKWHSFKLLVDPLIHKGAPRVLRFNGHLVPGQPHHEPPIVCDPRVKLPSALLRRLEPLELPLPRFKVDENYVGEVPKVEVTVDNLNDNVDKAFLAKMVAKHGQVVEIDVFRHPGTRKHLGLARIVFDKVKSARDCVSDLNNKSVMGNKLECYLDALGTKCKARFKEMTQEKRVVSNEDSIKDAPSVASENEVRSVTSDRSLKRDPRSGLKLAEEKSQPPVQRQAHQPALERRDSAFDSVEMDSEEDSQMSLAARISALRRSRDQPDSLPMDSPSPTTKPDVKDHLQKWSQVTTTTSLHLTESLKSKEGHAEVIRNESKFSQENHSAITDEKLVENLTNHPTKEPNPDYSDPQYWLRAAQKYAASVGQAQANSDKEESKKSPDFSSVSKADEKSDDSAEEASSHHLVDLDTRLKLLMTDHSSAMPAFLLDEFRHNNDGIRDSGKNEVQVDDKPLSRPPSPFLSEECYLKCHHESVKFHRRQLRRERRRQERLKNANTDDAADSDDRMSLSSLSDDLQASSKDHELHSHALYQNHPPPPFIPDSKEDHYNDYYAMQEAGLTNGEVDGHHLNYSYVEELPRSKEAYRPLIEEIVIWVVRELKATLRKELKKRICETLTFYLFEAWWEQQEKKYKQKMQRRPLQSRWNEPRKSVLTNVSEAPVVHIAANTNQETKKKGSEDITSLLEKQRESIEAGAKDRSVGNAFGLGGSLGLGFRGTIPKLPSFKMKSHILEDTHRGEYSRRKGDHEKENRRRRESRHHHRRRKEDRLKEERSSKKRSKEREEYSKRRREKDRKKKREEIVSGTDNSSSDERSKHATKSGDQKVKDSKSKAKLKAPKTEATTTGSLSKREALNQIDEAKLNEGKESPLPMIDKNETDEEKTLPLVSKKLKKKLEKVSRSSESSSSASRSEDEDEEEGDRSSHEETRMSSKSSSLSSSSSESESSSLEDSSEASSSVGEATNDRLNVAKSKESAPSAGEQSLLLNATKKAAVKVTVCEDVEDVIDVVKLEEETRTPSPSHIIDHCYAKPSESFPKSSKFEKNEEDTTGEAVAIINDHGYTPEVAINAATKRPAPAKIEKTISIEEVIEKTIVPIEKKPPSTKSQVKFSPRDRREQFEILYEFLTQGLDLEDMCYIKRSYEQLLNSSLKKHPWLNDTHWVNHPTTLIGERRQYRKQRQRETSPHKSGSCRTEGYYKMDAVEKMRTKYHLQRDDAFLESHPRNLAEGANKRLQSAQNLSREARSTQRRQLAVLGEEALNSDLLKFNQLKFRRKQLTFGKSPIHDWGLFALEAVGPDEMVIEYVGQVVRPVVSDGREKRYEKQGIGSSYFFRIDLDYVVDATQCGNLARFINHSCDPNCYAKVITVEGEKKIVIYSKQPIAVGEEITYDYKFPIEDEKIVCLCGSKNCRRYLN